MPTFQFKRSTGLNVRPTAANMGYGEVNLNINPNSAGMFIKTSANTVVKIGPPVVSDSAPPSPGIGEIWLDTLEERLRVYDGAVWTKTSRYETYPLDLAAPPLHSWGLTALTGAPKTPFALATQTTRQPNEISVVRFNPDESTFNANLYAEYEDEQELAGEAWYDQISNHTLKGSPLFYKKTAPIIDWGRVGGIYAPTPTTDLATRVWTSSSNLSLNETGTAMWCIIQFNSNTTSANNARLFSAGGATWSNGSFYIGRIGSTVLRFARNNAGSTIIHTNLMGVDDSTFGKNTVLIMDRGSGDITYSVNAGDVQTGNLPSTGTNYIINKVFVGGEQTPVASTNWNSPIATVSYWVGAPGAMPLQTTLLSAAEALHVKI